MPRSHLFRTLFNPARPRLRPWLASLLTLGLLALAPVAFGAGGLGGGPDPPPPTIAPKPRVVTPVPRVVTPTPPPPRVFTPPVSRRNVTPTVRVPTKPIVKKPIVKKPIIKKPIVKKPPVVVVPPGVTTTQNSLPTATTAGTPDTAAPAAISPVGGGSAPAVLATILLTLTTLLFGGLALLPRVPAARSALTKDRLLVLDRHRYELTALAAVGGLTLLVLLAI